MNKIWTVISVISIALLVYIKPQSVLEHMNQAAESTVSLMLRLLALYTVWMGMLSIAEKTGLTDKLAKLLRPVIRFLFGDVPEQTIKHLSLNMSANILGIGAATPAGISAIHSLDTGSETASDPMIMLLVLNATSLQMLPTTVISLRQSFGSVSPSDIIFPVVAASLLSAAFGVTLVKLLAKKTRKKAAQRHMANHGRIFAQTTKTV